MKTYYASSEISKFYCISSSRLCDSKVTTKNRPRTILLNTPACRQVVKIPCLLQVSTAPSTNVLKAVAVMEMMVLRRIALFTSATT